MSPHRDGTLAIILTGWVLLKKEKREQAPALQTKFHTRLIIPGNKGKSRRTLPRECEITQRMGTDGNLLVSETRSLRGIADKYQKTSRLSPVFPRFSRFRAEAQVEQV